MRFSYILILFVLTIGNLSSSMARTIDNKSAYLKADIVTYDAITDSLTASGNIFIKIDEYVVEAENINYDLKDDILFAYGKVKITDQHGKIIQGNKVYFKDKFKSGIIQEFIARLDKNTILAAARAVRLNQNKYILENTAFTPCEINCSREPIWQIQARHTKLDFEKEKITYKHTFFVVYGLPVMYVPYFSHPTPHAKAQSGFLNPRIKNDDLLIPIYIRFKPNMDLTLSPRISRSYNIIETEFRHKLNNGDYNITGSYGKIRKKTGKNVNDLKISKQHRFHIFTNGDFTNNNINYGFDINRASDKAYLTNYHKIYDTYLNTEIYANTINKRDYISLESFYFQDLRADVIKDKSPHKTPYVIPYIRTQHIFGLNEDETLLLNIHNNTAIYRVPGQLHLTRVSLNFALMHNIVTANGHMLSNILSNRGDFYWLEDNKNFKNNKQKTLYRNIPEITSKWRYPLVKIIDAKTSIKLEPMAMLVLGRKFEQRFNRFNIIDSSKSELSENNIFNSNKFSGIDFHEYGTRFSYGVNSTVFYDNIYTDIFLGQALHKNNVIECDNSEYVGNILVNLEQSFNLYYNFRKDHKFKPIRNELGSNVYLENVKANIAFAELHNLSKYFAIEDVQLKYSKLSQVNFDLNYQLIKNLWIGGGATLDISKSTKVLIKTIQMTYLFDCVSISASITDNFMHDDLRGIKKLKSNVSFNVGLKVINM